MSKELTPDGYGVQDAAEGAKESVPPPGRGTAFALREPSEPVVEPCQTGVWERYSKPQGVHKPSKYLLPRHPGRVNPPHFLQ